MKLWKVHRNLELESVRLQMIYDKFLKFSSEAELLLSRLMFSISSFSSLITVLLITATHFLLSTGHHQGVTDCFQYKSQADYMPTSTYVQYMYTQSMCIKNSWKHEKISDFQIIKNIYQLKFVSIN